MKLRVLAYALAILAFFMFVGSPFQQSAKALVGVDYALIAIIIAALSAMGISFVVSGAYTSLNEYVGSLMEECASDYGTTVSSQLNGVQTGTDKLGKLILNNRFVTYIQVFGAWLKSKFNLVDNGSVQVVTPGLSIGDFVSYGLPFQWRTQYYINNYEFIEIMASKPVYIIIGAAERNGTGGCKLYLMSQYENNQVTLNSYHGTTLDSTRTLNLKTYYAATGYYVVTQSYSATPYQSNYEIYANSSIEDALNGLSGDMSIDRNNIGIDIDTGTIVLPHDDPNYNVGDGAVLDVGAQWGDTYGDVTGEVIPGEFSDGKAGDTSIEYDSENAVSEQIEDTPAQVVSQDVEDYQVTGLTSVFPFCIPFDMYNFVECLAADPVAPSFTWRFYVPGICDQEIEIDLSEFDAAAQILRTMELLLFCVGLAFVTRKIIRG